MKHTLFYLGHPAHFHLFKNAMLSLHADQYTVCIKSKDVLEKLLNEHHIPYINVDRVSASKKEKSKLDIGLAFAGRMWKLAGIIRKKKVKVLAGSAAELAVLGRLLNKTSCIFFEDDFEKVKPFAKIAGPTATHLICPDCCSAWKWNNKKTAYNSYHELAYLHPDHFTPDASKVASLFDLTKRNFILRFSELGAYHDDGKTGITDELALRLIDLLQPSGNIYITSERPLAEKFEKYRIAIKASDIHHALYYADMFIGDSQTMTAEAAVLGTPAVRFNDFVGELGYLENLEHTYGLTYGIRTKDAALLPEKIQELLAIPDLKKEWASRKEKMLKDKCNFAIWMQDFLEKL
jgi:predicted glycosyltransferase